MWSRVPVSVLISCIAVLSLPGCTAISVSQTPETIGQGRLELAVEPGVHFTNLAGTPHVDLAARYGISDSIDLGFRLGQSLGEGQAKFALIRGDFLALAVTTTLSGLWQSVGSYSGGFVVPACAVIAGFGKMPFGEQLVVQLRVADYIWLGAESLSPGAMGLVASAGLGLVFRANERIRFMPEVAIQSPIWTVGAVNPGWFSTVPHQGVLSLKVVVLLGTDWQIGSSVEEDPWR